MKKEQIVTDGKKVGLVAYLIDKQDYLTDPRGMVLYRNMDVLKSALNHAGYTDSHDFIIMVSVNKTLVELSKCRVTEDGYIFYKDDVKYFIIEDRTRRLCSVGYAEFEKEDYKSNLLEIFNTIMVMGLQKVKPVLGNNRVLRFKLPSNSGCLNICSISTLVDINNKRKKQGDKAIPFIKEKQQNCLVIFTDKDIYDKRSVEEELVNKILDIVSSMKNVKYDPVDYNATIYFS